MKRVLLILLYITALSVATKAQQQTPQLLKRPAHWEFERFSLPPQFAPDIRYKGAEELRFAPGMFAKDSATYFTYAFVAALDSVTSISQTDIKNYLLAYYKGLCNSTAKERKLSIDTSQISATINKGKNTGADAIYNATLHVFGVFADGAPVALNMQIKVLTDKRASKTYLVFIASPLPATAAVWKELYSIQNGFTVP